MASLDFIDGEGPASLANQKPAPGDRFAQWEPTAAPVGPSHNAQADARLHVYELRVDYGVRLELRHIPAAQMAVALRLLLHLQRGGTVSVATGDAEARTYPLCGLAPKSTPEFTLSNARTLEYTFRVALVNVAAVPAPMLCLYP